MDCRKFEARALGSDSVPPFLEVPLAKLQESVVVVQNLKMDNVQKVFREPLARLQETISYAPVFITSVIRLFTFRFSFPTEVLVE